MREAAPAVVTLDLGLPPLPSTADEPADIELNVAGTVDALPTLREAHDQSERKLIADALVRSQGNISRAAQALDISRPTFHDILATYGINAKEFR